jgi:Neurotransmitter-gated ion-channel ligand binding domain
MRIVAVFLLCWLCAAGGALAQFVPDPARRNVDLPPDRNGPVPVMVDFFLLDVTSVNGATETFGASLYFDIKWKDPRLAFDKKAFGADRVLYTGGAIDEQFDTMWSPEITASNLTGDPQVLDRSLTIYPDGSVEYEVRITGEFSSSMELKHFPFDTQRLSIRLESFLWTADQVKLIAEKGPRHVSESLVVRDWRFISVTSKVNDDTYVTGGTYSRFVSTIVVERDPWFYIWSVIFPLALVTFFAVLCLLWDQESLNERVAQVLTCFLTVTAQNLAVSGDLPKISYFTRIDYAFLLTYAVLLFVAVESFFAKILNERSHALADTIDKRAAWVVSIVYCIGMAVIFWA